MPEPLPDDLSADRLALVLFDEALDIAPDALDAWLETRAAGRADVVERVHRLLQADARLNDGRSTLSGATAPVTGLAADVPGWAAVLPPAQLGVYALEELVGSGGMGAVYKARRNDGLFEQQVAIKFVRPLRGLLQVEPLVDAERRLLARMQHPNVARILDGGTTAQGLHYLIMEYVQGVALDVHVAEHGTSAAGIVGLMRQVCAAVAHAHAHLVLHCDIKPANILVTPEGLPKLIDFGVARIQDVVDANLPQGFTRDYTSPQRLAGEPATFSDDIYSLGRVLAELLTGELPTTGTDTLPATLDAELAAIVHRATAPERAARYARVEALDEDLAAWLDKRPVTAMAGGTRYRLRKFMQRHPWRVASAAVVSVGLVTALVVITGLYQRAEAARRDAERRFGEVRALANYMLFDLDARLEATPGNTAARREMVGRSQQYLDALASSARHDPALQREVAVGLARLAEVQGVPGRPHVGEAAAARANLDRALQMLEALAGRYADDWSWHRDIAQSRYLLALTVGGRSNDAGGQLALARQAEASVLRALELGAALAPREQARLHTLLTSTRLTQADAHRYHDAHGQAAALQASEEARLFALPPAIREQLDFDFQTGRTALLLGDSLYYLDRKPEALDAYQRATQRFQRGLAATPTHRQLLLGALTGYWYISSVMAEIGSPEQALVHSDQALKLAEQMLALDPQNREATRMRSAVRGDRAMVLARLQRHDEAIALIEASLPDKETDAARAPDDFERARDTAVPLRLLAQHYRDKGDALGGCRVLRRAVQAWEALDKRWGLSDFDRRTELQVVREALAGCG